MPPGYLRGRTEQSLIQCRNRCGAQCYGGCSVCPANVNQLRVKGVAGECPTEI